MKSNGEPILIIGFDSKSGDIPVLTVGTKIAKDKLEIINIFKGDEAAELYKKLTTRVTFTEKTEVDI